MADLAAGETFADGQTVTGARLNNHVNAAIIQPAFVSGKTNVAVPVAANDHLLFHEASSSLLKKVTIANLLALGGAGTVTSVALDMPSAIFNIAGSPITTNGTFTVTFDNQNANKVLIAPEDGTSAAPTFRALEARDMSLARVDVAAVDIDFNLSNLFRKDLANGANGPFTFSNKVHGEITVIFSQGAAGTSTISFNDGTLRWPNGTQPVMTTGIGKSDIFKFIWDGAITWGYRVSAGNSV